VRKERVVERTVPGTLAVQDSVEGESSLRSFLCNRRVTNGAVGVEEARRESEPMRALESPNSTDGPLRCRKKGVAYPMKTQRQRETPLQEIMREVESNNINTLYSCRRSIQQRF